MIKEIPIDPAVKRYILSETGEEPLTFQYKNHITWMIFPMFRKKNPLDAYVKKRKGEDALQVYLPKDKIKKNETFISRDGISIIENIILDLIKERFISDVFALVSNPHSPTKIKDAIIMISEKYHLDEEILAYETVKKRIQRHKERMEQVESKLIK